MVPIPTIKELLDELVGAQVFSKLDLCSSYHQVSIHSPDVEKCMVSDAQRALQISWHALWPLELDFDVSDPHAIYFPVGDMKVFPSVL